MVSGREKALMDIIKLYEEQLKPAEKQQDLVEVIFRPFYMGSRPGGRDVVVPLKYRGCPDNYVEETHYWIDRSEVSPSHPWFTPV